ncbi:MAG: N-6 DNA methylase [Ancylobacter novellus]|uniref:site-specific DNA-methyltransferase (adenine-specific) n=1 Tax=Ancylobacter novellus TaxID=921 RepID=A0A2W5K566_ANCNO|nr:MAG: N-6 DNA methylase [Ancylobacter novellus]
MNPSSDLVNKLWRLCSILRKDGVTYFQYVTELTYLLFLKMADERGTDQIKVPEGHRWPDLLKAEGAGKLKLYRETLLALGDPQKTSDRLVQAIFVNASTVIREPTNLATLVAAIDELEWFSDARDSFGDLYEGLLQKNAEETKRGAGQYFTPRVLIDVLARLMQPKAGEVIQDPASGTGGFLIAADKLIRAETDDHTALSEKEQAFQIHRAYRGMENVADTYRLLLMNLQLHGVESDHIKLGDTLSPAGGAQEFKGADLILTNPPFGPAGGRPSREDFTVTAAVASYQLPFVEHCVRALKAGGRAAVVVPDNVLFEDGRGRELRRMMMETCDLHTILRLPTGIFYAQGVKTNVLFFQKAHVSSGSTDAVWIYDMRTAMPAFGKTSPLRADHFDNFVTAYGDDPNGGAERTDQGETGRFRKFTRDEIAARGDNLDITWLREETDAEEGLQDPADIAAAILGHLKAAMAEIEALSEELEENEADVVAEAAE